MTAKDELRDLVEGLDEDLAQMWLEFLKTGDPVLRSLLLAPLDDEPETPEEQAAMEVARLDLGAGRWVTTDELRRRLGR